VATTESISSAPSLLTPVTSTKMFFVFGVTVVTAALIIHNFVIQDAVAFMTKRLWATTELAKLTSWESFWTCSNLFLILF
jgi:hypothetical protein